MWCIQRTNIYLEERQCELLDRIAAEEGVSRAEIIRRLLDRALAGNDGDVSVDVHAVESSFGALAGLDPAPRAPSEREAHLARMWALRP